MLWTMKERFFFWDFLKKGFVSRIDHIWFEQILENNFFESGEIKFFPVFSNFFYFLYMGLQEFPQDMFINTWKKIFDIHLEKIRIIWIFGIFLYLFDSKKPCDWHNYWREMSYRYVERCDQWWGDGRSYLDNWEQRSLWALDLVRQSMKKSPFDTGYWWSSLMIFGISWKACFFCWVLPVFFIALRIASFMRGEFYFCELFFYRKRK